PARTPGPAAVSVERPRSRRPSSGRRDRHEARGPSMTLHELGWRGDAPPTRADSVGRVAVEHRNGYVVYTEAGEVAAEVAGRLRPAAAGGQPPGPHAVGGVA